MITSTSKASSLFIRYEFLGGYMTVFYVSSVGY